MRWIRFLLGIGCALQILGWIGDATFSFQAAHTDPDFGPIMENQTIIWGVEGYGVSHWGENGLRDNGNGRVAGPRILVLGDSATAALQVDDSQTFCSLAERELRAVGWPVNLLNAGYTGRSVADYVHLGEKFRARFTHDWTLVVVYDDDWTVEAWDDAQIHFVYREGRLQTLPARGEEPTRLPAGNVLLPAGLERLALDRLNHLENVWQRQPPLFRATDRPDSPAPLIPLEQECLALQQALGGRLSIIHVPPFTPEPFREVSAVESALTRACQKHKIDFLEVSSAYRALVVAGLAPRGFANTAYNSGHWNREGHRCIAAAVTRHLALLHARGTP